jgi:hypothetical protein
MMAAGRSWPIVHVFDIVGKSHSRRPARKTTRPHERSPQGPYQVIRLSDERLRFPSYGGHPAPEGFAETATPDDADLVILNTCHIREKAADKSIPSSAASA